MRNPYAFGFWCLAVALVLLTTAMLASAAISAAEMKDIIAAVAAWSTAAQAITSLALVIFAMLGFTMWKRQVRYEKGMNVIWTAMAALHRVDVSFQRVATELLVSGTPVDFEVLTYLNERALGGYLKELEDQCVWMDKIVTDNEWEWVNHAELLRSHVIHYLVEYRDSPPASSGLEFVKAMAPRTDALQKAHAGFKEESSIMTRKLRALKETYNA